MSNVFMVLTFIGLAVPFFLVRRGDDATRKIYWISIVFTCLCVFLMAYPKVWDGIGLAALILFVMTLYAYFSSSYIKFGGKVYAFNLVDSDREGSVDDSDPYPDSYGGIATAQKTWWLMIGGMLICSGNIAIFIHDREKLWLAGIAVGSLVIFAVVLGYGDASWRYPIARGQMLQFVLAGIVTAGVFTVVYLIAYAVAKRYPLRRTKSMEYRAHPRHQTAEGERDR